MTRKEQEEFLTERGWHTWYHPNYWVHTKLIKDPKSQDYTNYGMPLEQAYIFEVEERKPFNGQFLGYWGGLRW